MENTKKAFTKKQLIIVIAVILLLAAVTIPTLCCFIEQQKLSGDIQLVRNLNTAVERGLASGDSDKTDTAYDSVVLCAKRGYLVTNIVAKSSMDIAWSRNTGRFMLIDTSTGDVLYPTADDVETFNVKGDEVNYFIFRSKLPTSEIETEYSVFAGNGWSAKSVELNGIGFDAGYNSGITNIRYANTTSSEKNVLIRTNGGKLEVNDETLSRIDHYASLSSLDIIKCHTASYHEHGQVIFANMKAGHIAFDQGASIEYFHFETTGTEDVGGKTYDTFAPIIVSYADGVEQPEYSRDDIRINPVGTKVCTLSIPEETNNIYLTKNGIYEQVKIEAATIDGEAVDDKEWVSASDATMKTKIASDQISNLYGTRKSAFEEDAEAPAFNNEQEREIVGDITVVDNGATKEEAESRATVNDIFRGHIDTETLEGVDILPNKTEYGILGSQVTAMVDRLTLSTFNALAHGAVYSQGTGIDGSDEWLLGNARYYDAADENAYRQDDGKYQYWHGDFVVSFNKDISAFSDTNTDNCIILAGEYGDWGWLKFPIMTDVARDTEVRLLDSYTERNVSVNYEELCTLVRSFACGAVYLKSDYDVSDPLTMTVEFRLYETEKPSAANGNSHNVETGNYLVVDTYSYTFGK